MPVRAGARQRASRSPFKPVLLHAFTPFYSASFRERTGERKGIFSHTFRCEVNSFASPGLGTFDARITFMSYDMAYFKESHSFERRANAREK